MDDGLDELFAGTDATAVESAAIDAAAPEADVSPTDEIVEDAAPDLSAEAEPIATPEVAPAHAQPPQAPDWNSPDNPHYQAAQQLAALRQIAAMEAQRQQAEALKTRWNDLTGGDPETAQQFGQLVAEVTAPLQQRAAQATQAEKALAAFHLVASTHLPAEQLQTLMAEMGEVMALEGVETMQRHIQGKTAAQSRYAQELAAAKDQIAQLQRQLSARGQLAEREASGADRVDGGAGVSGLDRRQRMEQAQTDDDFFAALFSAA